MEPMRSTDFRTRWTRWLVAAVVSLGCGAGGPAEHRGRPASAPASAPLIPIEELYGSPVAALPQVSPDGRWLAYLALRGGNLDLAIRPLVDGAPAGAARFATGEADPPVDDFVWSGDSRSILYLQDAGGDEGYHLLQAEVGRAGGRVRDLTPFPGVEVRWIGLPALEPGVAVIAMNRRDPALLDAYRVDLASGALSLADVNPGSFAGYLADARGRVLVATSVDPRGRPRLHHRSTEASPWRVVAIYPGGEELTPLAFSDRPGRIYVRTDHHADRQRLALFDLATGSLEPVAADPAGRVDLDGAIFDLAAGRVVASRFVEDATRWVSRDPGFQALLARAPGGGRNLQVLSRSRDGRLWTVATSAPTAPVAYHLVEPSRGRVIPLFRSRPWLDRRRLFDSRPIRLRARDRVELSGYLTLPAGPARAPHPTVLLVHGGPWSRDLWDFDADRQLLASRGYAVLSVNYRGSIGFGRRFTELARGGFAGAMQEDLVDAVDWAIARGVTDRRRVAIMGGSYGGYAALIALATTPERFACGVDYAGPVDLAALIEGFPPSWRPRLRRRWYRFVGDPHLAADRADMRRRSPITLAEAIRAPVLIFHGGNDPRVSRAQSDEMALRLHRRGVPVTYLLAADEGHGLADRDTTLGLVRATELFLAGCLGGRAAPRSSPEIDAAVEQLTVDLATLDAATRPR